MHLRTDTKNIVATVAFLIGVRKSAWISSYGEECSELLKTLENDKNAVTIRYLCKLRTTLMQRFKRTDKCLVYDFKNLDSIEWYDADNIRQLEKWGFTIILANKRAADYSLHFNTLIHDNIESCRGLLPDWIVWDYIKDLFIIPKYVKEQHQKYEFEKYMENIDYYPFQMYIHWKPQDMGNILYTDGKFLELLYQMNGDYFGDKSKYKNAVESVKNNIYDFIDNSYKTVLAVDCENSDVYKLYGMLKNLNRDEISKIEKIILFDDDHTNNGWDHLEKFIEVPVDHIEVSRVVDHKSIVDMRMATGICREFYKNDVSSFILLSSDSDYWGLISSLPEAEFLVVIEYSKCGQAIKETLDSHGIYYCSLDDFCMGNIDELKRAVLLNELKQYLPEILTHNGRELAHSLFEKARIEAGEQEINNFYDKYIKTLKLKVDDEGNFSVVLGK
ncbi:MAG: NYN domain-containing protein [Oscillospiraceae bacterium]|nr:NYN domain-containing protein [Oscillospiraceae bacterium]